MPAPSTAQRADPWRPALQAGALAVLVPVVVCTVVVALASQSLGVDTARGGARAWLMAVGAGIDVNGAAVTVVPIGGTALAGLLAALIADRCTREEVPDLFAFAAICGGAAGTIAAVLSAATSTSAVTTSFARAAFGAFLVVGGGAALGLAARRGAALRAPARLVPFLPALQTGVRAAAGVIGAAFVLVMVLAAARVQTAADLWAALDPGLVGGIVLAIVCLLALPTLVAWSVAVLLGPGIALGTDTRIDVNGADVGTLPAFPPLAVLPDPGPFPGLTVVLMVIPVLVAVRAGWQLSVLIADERLSQRLLHGALAGAVAGLALAGFALTGRGAVGPGLLAQAGPPVVSTLLLAVGSMAVGGALGSAGSHYRGARADRP